jgi:hypothetical protein
MCNSLKKLERGIRNVGSEIDDGLHTVGKVFDRGVHAAVGTMAGMAFPGITQWASDKLGYDNQWFGKGADLGTGIDMAAAAWFGGSQLAGMFGGQGAGIGGEQFMNGMGGFGGMTGSGAQGAGAFASGSGSGIGSMFGMSGNQAGGVMDLVRGGFGLYQSNQLKKASQPSAINKQADAELAALLADPSRVTSLPGYEAGIEAVQRGMAAQGFLGSGNMATALQKYGGDFYNNALTQYGNLSQLGRGGSAQYRMGGIELAGQALNSLGYGGLKLFGV